MRILLQVAGRDRWRQYRSPAGRSQSAAGPRGLSAALTIGPRLDLPFLVVLALTMVPFRVTPARALPPSDPPRGLPTSGLPTGLPTSSSRTSDAIAAFLHGSMLADQGHMIEALPFFREASAADSTSPDIPLMLARCYQKLGRPDSTLLWSRSALRLGPTNAEAAFLQASALRDLGRPEDALVLWREAYRLNPASQATQVNLSMALQQLGAMDIAQGRVGEATGRFLEAAKVNPDDLEPLRWLWKMYMGESRFVQADSIASVMLGIAPQDRGVLMLRALAWSRLGKEAPALVLAESLSTVEPGRRDAGMLASILLESRGRGAESERYLREVLQHHPGDRGIAFRLGVVLGEEGQVDSSLAVLGRLIAADPNDAQALNHAGYTCIDRGIRLPEAMDWVRRALALEPDNPAYLDSYGWGWYRMGQPDKALEPLNKAAGIDPKEVLILKHLGQAQEAVGQTTQAAETYRKGLLIEPKDPELPLWLKRLGAPSTNR